MLIYGSTCDWWFPLCHAVLLCSRGKAELYQCIWALDYANGREVRMATFRYANGDHQLLSFGYEYSTDPDDNWYSSATNKTYPLFYSLDFGQHGTITAQSYRADQLTYNVSAGLKPSYEGFATFNVTMFGIQATGYGVIEIV
ncbi:hypothetical protein BO78DRAFT_402165 [Aspergillus sclerotiicarbonarius CBS 121057]|uniref:Uncharacterized protein n=1 Tax=Aspergillus sclerotiicarbonarius (strain CBS 121057 / IBT 28362) TaxID=1448318 RepID=A0A319DRC0_ASPSB|nr:hypothetical protein BO78DRAFT_402165 [Aspergillus sclerotiicarbonarius CBS 121057]